MTNTLEETPQGHPRLLADETAARILESTQMAHLAYVWHDGTPRCTAIWFHWNGSQVVMASPVNAPKAAVLTAGSPIAVTIDDPTFPYASLMLRGGAEVDRVDGIAEEYELAAIRYLGEEQGRAWCAQLPSAIEMVRVKLSPDWVGLIDIADGRRLPSALAG